MEQLVGSFDGGSRGNPGISGAGWALWDRKTGELVDAGTVFVGLKETNNVSEYAGAVALLTAVTQRSPVPVELTVYGDSNLVIQQHNGKWKVNAEHLQPYLEKLRGLSSQIPLCQFVHIAREANWVADALSNTAMDEAESRRGTDLVCCDRSMPEPGKTLMKGAKTGAAKKHTTDLHEQGKPQAARKRKYGADEAALRGKLVQKRQEWSVLQQVLEATSKDDASYKTKNNMLQETQREISALEVHLGETPAKRARSDAEPSDVPTTRVRIRRTKTGQILQNCERYVGRAIGYDWNLEEDAFHNPIRVVPGKVDNAEAVRRYKAYLSQREDLLQRIADGELRGKTLGCFCETNEPCHADFLCELSNDPDRVRAMIHEIQQKVK